MVNNKVMVNYAFVLLTVILVSGSRSEAKQLSRMKRHLVYPKPGSIYQFIVGTGVPIPLENHAITIGWVVKAKYRVPLNASDYTNTFVTYQKRSVQPPALSRYDFYRMFEAAAERFGGGGKECMLRSICEASRIPLKGSNILAKAIGIFLLPSTTDEMPLTRSDLEYHSAERLGREETADCQILYPACGLPLTDLFTTVK